MSDFYGEPLTERESEVLALVAEGMSNREIAHRLSLAVSTVKWYVNQINQKLGTRTRDEIIDTARRFGLLDAVKDEPAKVKHNLPHQTTPFVGRHTELDQLYTLLTDDNVRLITILAPGGMGKTRLALNAAEQQLYNFKHGVYFVPLQALSESEHIVPQIATNSGYQFSNDGREPKQQLLNYLANKQMLLVLDTFEHLLDGAVLISDILQEAPDVKVLVTSREKLKLSGETVYSLRGMPFPTKNTPDMLDYEAVTLLIQTAKRVKPDWTITPDNQNDVIRVCQLTQGMPLGVVLAASWLDVYSLDRICDEIEQSADILQTDMRDVPERLRSIRAVFEYSWERLQPAEQQVFMKIGVFRGGCTPRAAEHITGANRRILQSLVNKALLTQNQSGRYDIHELLRQYAEAHLEASGEVETVRDAHMAYYVDAVHQRAADVKGRRQIEAFNEIEADFENVRAAWQWTVRQRDYASLCRMDAVFIYAYNRSRLQDALELSSLALEHLAADTSDTAEAARAWLQVRHAWLDRLKGHNEEAESLLRASLAIVSNLDDRRELALCLRHLSGAIANQGRVAEALPLVEKSLSLATEIADQSLMASGHQHVGYIMAGLGQMERGLEHTMRAYELSSEIGNRLGMADALYNLGYFSWSIGDWEASERHHQQGLGLSRETGDYAGISSSLSNLVGIALVKGHFEEAGQLAQESLMIASDLNQPLVSAIAHITKSNIAELKGNYAEAYQMAQEALTLAKTDGNWSSTSRARLRLAWTLCCLGAYDEAITHLSIDMKWRLEIGDVPSRLEGVAPFAPILARRGQYERAVELLELIFEHPVKMQSLIKHPRLTELRANLQAKLGEDAYNAAWERGKSLDLETVARELLTEFGDDTDISNRN